MGRAILMWRLREKSIPLDMLRADLEDDPPPRVPGTAVFLTSAPRESAPPALVHNLVHHKVLHEQVVLLTVHPVEVPHVGPEDRVDVEAFPNGFYRVTARNGFMQDPDINEILTNCRIRNLHLNLESTTFFLGRETLIITDRSELPRWQMQIFEFLSSNALNATAFFHIPPEQVYEVGVQVEL